MTTPQKSATQLPKLILLIVSLIVLLCVGASQELQRQGAAVIHVLLLILTIIQK